MIRNVHARTIDAPAQEVGALLDRLASTTDALWPAPPWPRLRLDGPLAVGARGGHGPIRYHVTAYQPSERLRFEFDPVVRVCGYHELTVEREGPRRCTLRHVLEGQPTSPAAYLRWCLVIRWLHDAVLEDLLDNAERAATGTVVRPYHWGPWVPVLRRVMTPSKPARAQPAQPVSW